MTVKNELIISTAGLSLGESRRVRCYCNLMQNSLSDKWLFTDEFEYSHICLVRDDYYENVKSRVDKMSQIQVVINRLPDARVRFKYQMALPITGDKIREILNDISEQEKFNGIEKNKTPEIKSNGYMSGLFKSVKDKIFSKSMPVDELKSNYSKHQLINKLRNSIKKGAEAPCKIVLFGSPGSGKTTTVHTISNGNLLTSEVSATDSVAAEKQQTTVGIDFAEIELPETSNNEAKVIRIIGTPGQMHFNYIWSMIGKDADALVILVDLSRPEPMSYLKFYHDFIINKFNNRKIFCAFTHKDKFSGNLIQLKKKIFSELNNIIKTYEIDVRKRAEVLEFFSDLSKRVEQNFNI